MPWFVGDFYASTQSWSGEERGLYLLALGLQWTEKALPNDVRNVRKALNYDRTSFARLWPRVSTKFVQTEAGLINPRLEAHRSKVIEKQRFNAERASRAASSRWQNQDAPSNAPSIGGRMLQASIPHAPSITPENAIQSNPDKNKSKRPVDMWITSSPEESEQRGERHGAPALQDAPSIDQGAALRAWVLYITSAGKLNPPTTANAMDRAGLSALDVFKAQGPALDTLRARFIAAYVLKP